MSLPIDPKPLMALATRAGRSAISFIAWRTRTSVNGACVVSM